MGAGASAYELGADSEPEAGGVLGPKKGEGSSQEQFPSSPTSDQSQCEEQSRLKEVEACESPAWPPSQGRWRRWQPARYVSEARWSILNDAHFM